MPKFEEYAEAGTLDGTEIMLVKQGASTKRVTLEALTSYFGQELPWEEVTDPALNAAVSTAIVDANQGVLITLTGAGNGQTLQNPTDVTVKKRFVVANLAASTDPVTVDSMVLQPGEAQEYLWTGSAWTTVTGIDAAGIDFTPAGGLDADNVQEAIEELDSEKAPSGHTHGYLTNPMTALGDIIIGVADGEADNLPGNITTTKQFLSQTGTGAESAAPVWEEVPAIEFTNPGAGIDSEMFGANTSADGDFGLAIGNGASAPYQKSIALGTNAVTTAPKQLVVGGGDDLSDIAYTDNFDRDDNDSLGTDWTESTGISTNIQILSNNARLTKQRLATYNQVLGNNQYAKMVFKALNGNTYHGIGIRMSNVGDAITGYGLLIANPFGNMDNLSFYLMRFISANLADGEVGTGLHETSGQSLVDGDELELRAVDTTIGMYKNDVLVYETTDNNISAGKAAMIADRSSGDTSTLDIASFEAGEISGAFEIDDVYIGKGVTHTTPAAITYHGTGGSGANIAGGDLIHAPGKGTGNATRSKYRVQTPNPTASGSDAQALTDKFAVGNEIELTPLDNAAEPVAPTAALKMFAYNKSVADDGIIYLPLITTNAMGFVVVGDDEERAFFTINSTGTVTLINSSAGIVVNADTDGKFCLGTGAAQEPLQVKNRLGAQKTVNIMLFHD